MIAYNFRVMNDDGTPTGYSGFAVGRNITAVFWEIDQYVDPYRVEIMTASAGGYCLKNPDAVDDDDDEMDDYSEIEISDYHEPASSGAKWRKPDWSKVTKS